jgi:pyruvate-formate lyase-activating enzyme
MDENFQDYKKPSMLIATCKCDWKCLKEQCLDISICQNSDLSKQNTIDMPIDVIVDRYINNPITEAIIIGGLEPFLQFEEVLNFIFACRKKTDDDIVIYTGYYPNEIENKLILLSSFKNIIVKFGRFIPDSKSKYDEILGIALASDNQFAMKTS